MIIPPGAGLVQVGCALRVNTHIYIISSRAALTSMQHQHAISLSERGLYADHCAVELPPYLRPRLPSVALKAASVTGGSVLHGCASNQFIFYWRSGDLNISSATLQC